MALRSTLVGLCLLACPISLFAQERQLESSPDFAWANPKAVFSEPTCSSCSKSNFTAGVGVMFLSPRFESNPAYTAFEVRRYPGASINRYVASRSSTSVFRRHRASGWPGRATMASAHACVGGVMKEVTISPPSTPRSFRGRR